MGDGIAHLHLFGIFDATNDVTHLARSQLFTGYHIHLQYTNLVGYIFHSGVEEFYLVALTDNPVRNFEICNDAAERVEDGVENQCL